MNTKFNKTTRTHLTSFLTLALIGAASPVFAKNGSSVVIQNENLRVSTAMAEGTESAAQMTVTNSVSKSEISYLSSFRVAHRNQRVRFLIGGSDTNSKLINRGEAYKQLEHDRIKGTFVNALFSSAATGQSANLPFEKNSQPSLIVQPEALMCYSDLLKMLVSVGNDAQVIDVFARFRIDEVNLFLKPVVTEALISRADAQRIKSRIAELTLSREALYKETSQGQGRIREITGWVQNIERSKTTLSPEDQIKFDNFKAEILAYQSKVTAAGQAETELTELKKSEDLANQLINQSDLRLELSPVAQIKYDPAINIQIPFVTNTLMKTNITTNVKPIGNAKGSTVIQTETRCVLPSTDELKAAILEASQK